MPNKYADKKGWKVPKQNYKIKNWSEYNESLKHRGEIDFWLSEEAIEKWHEENQINDGTGAPRVYSDFAIIVCHEIRQVYRLPLRQTEGFVNSLFKLLGLSLACPDYSTLSKRLSLLNIKFPRYRNKTRKPDDSVSAIAIDSSGLKRFGRDEWHQEKYKVSAKRSWRKLHIAVDIDHVIHACVLTDRFTSDDAAVPDLLEQVEGEIEHVTADGAYDKNPVYNAVSKKFPDAEIIIPAGSDAVYNKGGHPQRNRNLQEIKTFGRMNWQRVRNYGQRNCSELSIHRYKRILGNQLHGREFSRQENEAMIGCGILNKMTSLGMPVSYRSA